MSGKESIARRSRSVPTPEPPTVTMQTFSSGAYPSSWRSAGPVSQVGGVEPGHVARKRIVIAGPVTDHRQVRAEAVGHDVVGVAYEDSPAREASGT